MTTGEVIKNIFKFFKSHPEAIPMRQVWLGTGDPSKIRCCGLGAAYLQTYGTDCLRSLYGSFEDRQRDFAARVSFWLQSSGISIYWKFGFTMGFDDNSTDNCSAFMREDENYKKGYKAGQAVARRLFGASTASASK